MQAAFDHFGEQYAGLEVGGDAERFKPRGEGAMGAAAVEGGDQADLFKGGCRRSEVGHDALEIARRDSDVGVVDEQEGVAGVGCELNEGADFTVGPEAGGAMDELDGKTRKFALKFFDGCDGWVLEGGNAEEKLVIAGVGLAAMAAEGVQHCGVKPLEGLEDGDAGGEGGKRGAAGGDEDPGGEDGGEKVAHAGDGEDRGKNLHGLGECVGHGCCKFNGRHHLRWGNTLAGGSHWLTVGRSCGREKAGNRAPSVSWPSYMESRILAS